MNFTNWPLVAVVAAPFARYHDLYDRDGAGSGRRGRKNRFLIRPRRKKFNCDPLLWRYIRLDQWWRVATLWFLPFYSTCSGSFNTRIISLIISHFLWKYTVCDISHYVLRVIYLQGKTNEAPEWCLFLFGQCPILHIFIVSWRQVYNYKGCGGFGFGLVAGINPLNFDCPILGGGVGILGAQWGAGSLLVITAPPWNMLLPNQLGHSWFSRPLFCILAFSDWFMANLLRPMSDVQIRLLLYIQCQFWRCGQRMSINVNRFRHVAPPADWHLVQFR